jgi:hypothetical protein
MFLKDLGVHDITGVIRKEIGRRAAENDGEIVSFIVRAKAERDAKSFDSARTFQRVCLDHYKNLY